MRDANPNGELSFWLKVAMVVDALPDEDSTRVTSELVTYSVNPDAEPSGYIKAAWEALTEEAFYAAVDEALAEATD